MKKKKKLKSVHKTKSILEEDIERLEKEITANLTYTEAWIIQKRKFLIKLLLVLLLILILLIIATLLN